MSSNLPSVSVSKWSSPGEGKTAVLEPLRAKVQGILFSELIETDPKIENGSNVVGYHGHLQQHYSLRNYI